MPAYAGINQATLLRENKQVLAWQNEIVPASQTNGSLSIAFQLERVRSVNYPWGFSVEVAFAGNPGTFEVDVMVADTDNPNNYIPVAYINQTNTFYVGRADVLSFYPKYVALYMNTLGNSVAVTGQITR
jgi:hypothetical protein